MQSIHYILITLLFLPALGIGQTFERSVLSALVFNPWEITYGADDHLWVSERNGTVLRIHPETGIRTAVFAADDYFSGAESERAPCGLSIGANTYGLALHPEFLNPDSSFVYLYYSYNSGTNDAPTTEFKIVQLKWNATSETITEQTDIVTNIPNGYDHFGGRMMAIQQNGENYLYYSIGDLGSNRDDCYPTLADNPNNFAQDPTTQNGKIHRVYMNGTIPADNPIPGNSFFTRGHRNPQGLAFNPTQNIVYDIEHGHTTDDEINVLQKGLNYGWKDIQGYHDGNYEGELNYVQNYTPNPAIENDQLVEPLYAWGTAAVDDGNFSTWPTVAPSDGIYYGSDGIPEWTNSLLVVTLKDGSVTDQEVFQFQLNPDGVSLAPSTEDNPNPKTFFSEDQDQNGRLRDIAVSPDGKKLFLITNNRNGLNPIIVYTLKETTATQQIQSNALSTVSSYPNPFSTTTTIEYEAKVSGQVQIEIFDALGKGVRLLTNEKISAGKYQIVWDGTDHIGQPLPNGIYYYTIRINQLQQSQKILLFRG